MAAAYVKLVGRTEASVSYTVQWSKVSGPGTVTFSDSTALVNEATFSAAGTYVLKLTVTTADFVTEDEVTITCTANAAPVVAAGSDFSVMQSTNANIEGTATDDGFPALHFYYNASTTVLGTPATGTIRFGNANINLSTQMNIAVVDRYGVNRQADLLSIPAGSVIFISDPNDPSRWVNFACSAFSLFGGFAFCTMSSVTASSNAPFSNNEQLDFTPTKALTYSWAMTSGTGSATFGSSTSASTTVSFSTTGAKVLTLSVSDGVLTGTDTVSVDVNSVFGTDFVRAASQAVPGGASLDANGTPFFVDMSRFPNGWWTAVDAAGATIRVLYATTTTQLPFHLVNFNKVAKTGLLVFKSQAFSGGTGIDIYCGNASNTAYGVNDTYGRYNVYRTAIGGAWLLGGGTDYTRNARNMTTEGTPTIGTGPLGSSAYQYSTTARSRYLLPTPLTSNAVSFFAATNTTSPDANSYFFGPGIGRSVGGTLNSYNNSVYLTAAGTTLGCTISSLNGSGVWQGSGATCTAETWKGLGGVHTSDTSRQAATANSTGALSVTKNVVVGLDHIVLGHFPTLLASPGIVTNPNLSLCLFFTEAVNVNELKYLDLMLKQSTFWGTWTLNP